MGKIGKPALIDLLMVRTGLPRSQVAATLGATLDLLTERLADGDTVDLSGFGVFDLSIRRARRGRNPRTGEVVEIGGTRIPKFRPSRALLEAMDADFEENSDLDD